MTELPSSTYTWNLDTTNATQDTHDTFGKYFKSPLFKMHRLTWHLQLFPNCQNKQYVGLYLFLKMLPTNVSKIVMERRFTLLETNANYTQTTAFKKGVMNNGWSVNSLRTTAIKNMTRFTIKVDLTLIHVFDSNGKDISEQYINQTEQKSQAPMLVNDDKYQEHEVRLNSLTTQVDQMMKTMSKMENTLKDIQLQMNEEQKNDNKDLKKEVEEIKKNVQMLLGNKNNDNEMDKDKVEFKNWIEVKLKLPQYYDVFVKNGVETLNVAKLLTNDELNEMGITKIGHKVQILKEIQQLQQQSDKQLQEGGTAYV
eukprot:65371_1